MSGMDVPMRLDEAMLRHLERVLGRLEPDPLFRRRLRGHVVNQYVAVREGLVVESRPKRQMGKLGRSVLYASFAAAMSVSAAGAAAQGSLPGDPLYGVKLQLEDVRMRVAPPSVRAELAEMALAERVEELEQLAASGAWDLVPQAAARLAEARQELIRVDPTARSRAAAGELGARDALEAVMAQAPLSARGGLERAMQVIGPPALGGGERTGKPLHPPANPPTARPGAANPGAADPGGAKRGAPDRDRPAAGSDAASEPRQSPGPRGEETGKPPAQPERGSTGRDSAASE